MPRKKDLEKECVRDAVRDMGLKFRFMVLGALSELDWENDDVCG